MEENHSDKICDRKDHNETLNVLDLIDNLKLYPFHDTNNKSSEEIIVPSVN